MYSGPICDPHMHQWDTVGETGRPNNNHILGDVGCYVAEHYADQFSALNVTAAVHVEAFPTNQVAETTFVMDLINGGSPIRGIVANANISMQDEGPASTSEQKPGMNELQKVLEGHVAEAGPSQGGYLKGIRWVLNYEPSWPQVHRGDYFTDSQFASGFQLLAQHKLSFDLQCNPHQLVQAATFFSAHPDVPVIINHVGCLKLSDEYGRSSLTSSDDKEALETWRAGMKAMAALPHVYVKLSMLSYSVKDFWKNEQAITKVGELVHEIVNLFTPSRCMFASNFPVDGFDGCTPDTLYSIFMKWAEPFTAKEQQALFHTTATLVYRL